MTYEEEIKFFRKLTDKMCAIFAAKRNDYGPSTRETWLKYGPVSMLTRMSDKMARLEQLLVNNKNNKVQNESIDDTFLDLANYCLIAILERETIARSHSPDSENEIVGLANL